MGEAFLERERKFDVPDDFGLPDLGETVTEEQDLESRYFDTDDALLQARGVTVRYRTGGSDDGWQVKIPDADGRLELHVAGAASAAPAELMSLLCGLRSARPLEQRAVLRTARELHAVRDDRGALVAEVADDRVTAYVEETATTTRWREVEIELGPAATGDTMAVLSDAVTTAGAEPCAVSSKYARAVGVPVRHSLAGLAGLVDDYLQAQYEQLARGDLRMRRAENAVHRTRVAVRRIRSSLRIFGPLLDQDRTTRLDAELKWYAEVLGAVRDLDVFRSQLEHDLDHAWAAGLLSEGAHDLQARAEAARERRWQQVLRTLGGDRYEALLHELDDWRRKPPWTDVDPDAQGAKNFLRSARHTSDRRLGQATAAAPRQRGEAFHRARKAAKRTRYAAELVRPELGEKAKEVAKTHERRQDRLGRLQDHRMMIQILQDLAAGASGETAFACGSLAQRHAAALEAVFRETS